MKCNHDVTSYKSMPEGTINTRVVVHAYETDYELADVESAYDLAFVDPGDPASLALEGARQIGVDANHKTAINGYNAYNETLQKLLADGMDWDAAHEAAFVESGIFKEVAVLELNVSIEPSEAAEPNFKLDGERTYELSDATVILKTLTVDTASTMPCCLQVNSMVKQYRPFRHSRFLFISCKKEHFVYRHPGLSALRIPLFDCFN